MANSRPSSPPAGPGGAAPRIYRLDVAGIRSPIPQTQPVAYWCRTCLRYGIRFVDQGTDPGDVRDWRCRGVRTTDTSQHDVAYWPEGDALVHLLGTGLVAQEALWQLSYTLIGGANNSAGDDTTTSPDSTSQE